MSRAGVELRAWALGLLAVAAPTSEAHAHGGAAQALSIASMQGPRAHVVQLNEGLAVRRPEGFRFVCPVLWGQDTTAPAESIPGGPVVIGGVTGLYLLGSDGAVERHPDDSADEGQVLSLVRNRDALYGLRYLAERVELIRIEEDRVSVVWSGEESFQDLAVTEDALALVRVDGTSVRALQISPSGDVLQDEQAVIAESATLAWARPLGDELYVAVVLPSTEAELGRIEEGRWQPMLRGYFMAGPIELVDGTRLIGIEGVLHALEDGELRELDASSGAECLRTQGELAYACSMGNLRELEGQSLGAPLFMLEELGEPDLELVPEELRAECELQWDRYVLLELGMRGIEPRDLTPEPDAGTRADAASDLDPDRDAASDEDTCHCRQNASSGCQIGARGHSSGWLAVLAACLTTALCLRLPARARAPRFRSSARS